MKKTLLAAALLAGFAGVAQAETSVTLYGLIDTGIGYNKLSGDAAWDRGVNNSRVGMLNGVQSGSRWGLRGSEDLGDGLRAVFQLESGFDSSNGNSKQDGRLFGRQATVGLASDNWGQIDFGRQTNMASKYFAAIDPFGAGFDQANIGHTFSAANTVRYDNSIMYQTPSFSGFQFGVGYSFNADKANGDQSGYATADNTRAVTAGLRYVNGPWNVALSFDQLRAANKMTAAEQDATPRSYAIGGSYDFEVVKLALSYARTTDGWFTGINANGQGVGNTLVGSTTDNTFQDGFRANSYMVGLSAPIGAASNVFGSWQHASPNGDLKNTDVFALGYTYDLSKRTDLYAYGSYTKNFAFVDDLKSTAVGVGLRHRF